MTQRDKWQNRRCKTSVLTETSMWSIAMLVVLAYCAKNMEIAECGQNALAQFSTHTTFAWQESNFGNEASAFCQKYKHVRTFGRVLISKQNYNFSNAQLNLCDTQFSMRKWPLCKHRNFRNFECKKYKFCQQVSKNHLNRGQSRWRRGKDLITLSLNNFQAIASKHKKFALACRGEEAVREKI